MFIVCKNCRCVRSQYHHRKGQTPGVQIEARAYGPNELLLCRSYVGTVSVWGIFLKGRVATWKKKIRAADLFHIRVPHRKIYETNLTRVGWYIDNTAHCWILCLRIVYPASCLWKEKLGSIGFGAQSIIAVMNRFFKLWAIVSCRSPHFDKYACRWL